MKSKEAILKRVVFILSTVLSLVLVVFNGLFVTLIRVHLPLGAKLVYSAVYMAVMLFEICILIYYVSKLLARFIKIRAIAYLAGALAVLFLFYIPYSSFAVTVNCKINRERREEFVENLDVSALPMTAEDTYYVGDIRISTSGEVSVYESEDGTYIYFDLNRSLSAWRALVYSSENKAPTLTEYKFHHEYENVEKLYDNWYIVTVSYKINIEE